MFLYLTEKKALLGGSWGIVRCISVYSAGIVRYQGANQAYLTEKKALLGFIVAAIRVYSSGYQGLQCGYQGYSAGVIG